MFNITMSLSNNLIYHPICDELQSRLTSSGSLLCVFYYYVYPTTIALASSFFIKLLCVCLFVCLYILYSIHREQSNTFIYMYCNSTKIEILFSFNLFLFIVWKNYSAIFILSHFVSVRSSVFSPGIVTQLFYTFFAFFHKKKWKKEKKKKMEQLPPKSQEEIWKEYYRCCKNKMSEAASMSLIFQHTNWLSKAYYCDEYHDHHVIRAHHERHKQRFHPDKHKSKSLVKLISCEL